MLYVHRKMENLTTTEISKCLFFIIAAWYKFCHPNVLLNFISFCVIARIQNLILEEYFFSPILHMLLAFLLMRTKNGWEHVLEGVFLSYPIEKGC